jgi:molecular chaperone HscB
MQLDSDDFSLFGLPETYRLDRADLDARWKRVAAQVHPDRHTGQGAAAQARAMQWAMRVNQAYRRLRDPLQRAAYLCERRGAPIEAESNTRMCNAFLTEQMRWREDLEDAASETAIDRLADDVRQRQQGLFDTVARELDELKQPHRAAEAVRSLMFVARFLQDIDKRRDALFPL